MTSQINSEKIDNNLMLTVKIFQKHNIPYWICHGTLLGVIRDKKLIEWDPDIDIAIWDKTISKDKIIEIMTSYDFELVTDSFFIGDELISFNKKGGRKVDIHFYKTIYNKDNGQHMAIVYMAFFPKNIFMKFINAMSMAKTYNGKFKFLIKSISFFQSLFLFIKLKLIKSNLFYKSAGYTEPLEFYEKFKEIDYFNVKVTVPFKSEECLEYIYGEDWKTPKKDFYYAEERKDSPTTI